MITSKKVIWGLVVAVAIVLIVAGLRLVNRRGPAPPLVAQSPSPAAPKATPSPTPTPLPPPPDASPQPTSEQPRPPQATGRPPITGHPVPLPLQMEHKLDLNLCEYYARRGDYEEAVACYQARLKLDTSNDFVRRKIENIIKTCKRENEIMQIDLKCEPKQGAQPAPVNPPSSPDHAHADGKGDRELEPGRW